MISSSASITISHDAPRGHAQAIVGADRLHNCLTCSLSRARVMVRRPVYGLSYSTGANCCRRVALASTSAEYRGADGIGLPGGSGIACRGTTVSPALNGLGLGKGMPCFATIVSPSLDLGCGCGAVFCACIIEGGNRNNRLNNAPAYLMGRSCWSRNGTGSINIQRVRNP